MGEEVDPISRPQLVVVEILENLPMLDDKRVFITT